MSDPLIISVSGLRGIVGTTLTPRVVVDYVAAFAAELPTGPVLVTHDGRATGPVFAQLAMATLAASGFDVLDGAACATPTTGLLVRHLKCVAGVQISASHNPAPYNGIKLFGGDGRVIPAGQGAAVRSRYEQRAADWQPHDTFGNIQPVDDAVTPHVEAVLRLVDVTAIRKCEFHVLLDSNHGAGGAVGRTLLDELGCRVTHLGPVPDGQFAHLPEPTRENLQAVTKRVRDTEAVLGFCQDPDADRLAIVDAGGNYLGEEYTLAICVQHWLTRRPGPVVTNCSTSRMTEDLAQQAGVPLVRSAVGEANVVDAMLRHGATIGGEGNGGVIHPDVVLVRDSITGMALVLDAMAATGLSVAELAAGIPRYELEKAKVDLPTAKVPAALAALEQHFAAAKPDRLDGLRLDWPDRWLLVRASNTEPIVRVFAEAPTALAAANLCREAEQVIAAVR